MTPPRWQQTYPNTWRDKAVIYPLSVVLWVVVFFLFFWLFVEAMGPRRGA